MFANLYRSMAKVGMPNPRDVDQLYIWECAVLIGTDREDGQDEGRYAHLHADIRYRAARAAYESGEGPPPDPALKFEWGDASADERELMAVLASGSSLS